MLQLELNLENLRTHSGSWTLAEDIEEILKSIDCLDENGEVIAEWRVDHAKVGGYKVDIGEWISINEIAELQRALNNWNNEEILIAAAEYEDDFKYVANTNEEDWLLLEDVNDDVELGEYYADFIADELENSILFSYFDFEKYGRDIRLSANGGFTFFGWIEYIG